MKQTTQGYTLFELLASIAIIAILAAILLTTYSVGVRKAKATVCISNLQQIGHAMALYRDDHGEYPMNNMNWPGIQPYLGYSKLRCPVVEKPLSIGDYFLHAFFPDGLADTAAKRECMALRSAEYPIAFDMNHNSPLVIRSIEEAFMLVLRQGGSVERLPSGRLDEMSTLLRKRDSNLPCPEAGSFDNL